MRKSISVFQVATLSFLGGAGVTMAGINWYAKHVFVPHLMAPEVQSKIETASTRLNLALLEDLVATAFSAEGLKTRPAEPPSPGHDVPEYQSVGYGEWRLLKGLTGQWPHQLTPDNTVAAMNTLGSFPSVKASGDEISVIFPNIAQNVCLNMATELSPLLYREHTVQLMIGASDSIAPPVTQTVAAAQCDRAPMSFAITVKKAPKL